MSKDTRTQKEKTLNSAKEKHTKKRRQGEKKPCIKRSSLRGKVLNITFPTNTDLDLVRKKSSTAPPTKNSSPPPSAIEPNQFHASDKSSTKKPDKLSKRSAKMTPLPKDVDALKGETELKSTRSLRVYLYLKSSADEDGLVVGRSYAGAELGLSPTTVASEMDLMKDVGLLEKLPNGRYRLTSRGRQMRYDIDTFDQFLAKHLSQSLVRWEGIDQSTPEGMKLLARAWRIASYNLIDLACRYDDEADRIEETHYLPVKTNQ